MKIQKQTIEVSYEKLSLEIILKANNNILKVLKDNTAFYFILNIKEKNDKLVVFSNGAVDFSKKRPPVFQRSSWHSDINANCIYVDDPTIHNSNLTIGWGIGEDEHHYLTSINQIITTISKLLEINNTNIIYYGSSAGGTMSIMLATMHIGSKALVNNPQAFTELYFDGKVVEKILNKNFPGNNFYDVTEKYPERFSITECFKKHNHIPKTLYVFNGSSYTDYDKQYTHLIKKVTSEDIDLSNIEFLIYHDKKLKHGPLSKDKTVYLINSRLVYDDL